LEDDRIIALALLTSRDLNNLSPCFTRVFPVDGTPCFGELLAAIDEADQELWRNQNQHLRDGG
jgi:hypothetical protein